MTLIQRKDFPAASSMARQKNYIRRRSCRLVSNGRSTKDTSTSRLHLRGESSPIVTARRQQQQQQPGGGGAGLADRSAPTASPWIFPMIKLSRRRRLQSRNWRRKIAQVIRNLSQPTPPGVKQCKTAANGKSITRPCTCRERGVINSPDRWYI